MSREKQPARFVEFIRGRYDGHIEPLTIASETLPGHIHCCVSEDVFGDFQGQSRFSQREITSYAVRDRKRSSDGWVYQFSGAVSPGQIPVDARSQ